MKKEKRAKSTFWKDFKAFISRGNIVDLAVAVVVGAAFTAIVNSLVNDIIKPLIALLVDEDMSELIIVLREAVVNEAGETVKEAITLNYGNLIMAILTFLIDAFVIFTVLRIVTRAKKHLKEEGEKFFEKLKKKEEELEEKTEEAEKAQAAETQTAASAEAQSAAEKLPQTGETAEQVLCEIRDLLKNSALANPACEKAEPRSFDAEKEEK